MAMFGNHGIGHVVLSFCQGAVVVSWWWSLGVAEGGVRDNVNK